MSTFFSSLLIAHVVFGIVGAIACYVVLLSLLKKTVAVKTIKWVSALAFGSYFLSWLSGGYYYVFYYGDMVKPTIKEGAYPWAHLIFMEAKEHIFLMLPFATFALWAVIWIKGKQLDTDPKFKASLILLCAIITILATIITLSGIIISGAGR